MTENKCVRASTLLHFVFHHRVTRVSSVFLVSPSNFCAVYTYIC